MMGTVLAIRKSWSKSLLVASALGFGSYTLKNYLDVTTHMRSLCNDLEANFSKPLEPTKILVVLNPAANKHKAEKLFRRFSEPIFHLCGYNVEVFRTQNMGHAKCFIESMAQLPDAIVVAGGEGTSSEVVTGLLRRSDSPCPIVILPLGAKSAYNVKSSANIFQRNFTYVKALTDSSMILLNGKPQNASVIQYDVVDKESEKPLKPIYGLASFSWGLIKDIDTLKDKYWLFGALRKHAAFLFNSFSNKLIWQFEADYNYTPPCSGCQNCFNNRKADVSESSPKSSGFFFLNFISNKSEQKEINSNDDPFCGKRQAGHLRTSQLYIDCKANNDNFYELETRATNTLNPGLDAIKNMNEIVGNSVEPSLVFRSRTIELSPSLGHEGESFYSIDGEEYDVRPVKISLIPNAIKVYSK